MTIVKVGGCHFDYGQNGKCRLNSRFALHFDYFYIYKETLIKFKKAKIILAGGGAFVGDHANVKPNRLNIANRAVKHYAEIPTGISAVDVEPVRACCLG